MEFKEWVQEHELIGDWIIEGALQDGDVFRPILFKSDFVKSISLVKDEPEILEICI